ncbi:MAG TPA: hypothetical protein VK886_21695 [Vicinamibacterales bacterium]|nr:hypothetical protein [Vicinamibacterales bacterium]
MFTTRLLLTAAAVVAVFASSSLDAQAPPDPKPRIAAQKEAMARLAFLDGTWRGPASMNTQTGKHTMTQTERIGPFLDGSVKVIEGRGYEADGTVSFNALAIISYDPDKQAYSMRSYAQGRSGDFPVTVKADGFSWEIPAGPMTIRYTATVKNGTWHEVGDRIAPGREPVRFFEMTLTRVGDTDWPAGGAIPPK